MNESEEDGVGAGILADINALIARNTADAPHEPGLYRMPCGECYVDFFIGADGTEHWLVPGDETEYTRETVTIARHGEFPWERLYTLAEAAEMIRTIARDDQVDSNVIVDQLANQLSEVPSSHNR